MPSKNRNKRRRLTASADIDHEVAASDSLQHSPLMYSSLELTASPSKFVGNSMATPSSCISSPTLPPRTLPSGMYHHSEISCSVDVGKNKKSLMTDIIHDKTLDEIIKCSTISDGHLLDAINSESSCEAEILLHTKVDSFTQDGLNQALISACRRGHKLLVQTLVRVGANIEHPDENGNTPLLICAEQGFTDIVWFLVSRHANVNARNYTGNTALILSVHPAGATDLTRLLLEQQDVDIHHENQDGDTALNRATQFMDVDTMIILLEKSMVRNTNKDNTEIYVTRYEDSHFFDNMTRCVKQEIISATAGLKDVYTILKEHLITKTCLLELAIKAGDTKSLDIFLDCQFFSSTVKKMYIDDALMYMLSNSQYSSDQTFSPAQITIIQKLLLHGADVTRSSPASRAVESGDFQLVELMCSHGAELNRHLYPGEIYPLCIAARKGRRDLIELLLKHGADMNGCDFSESALDYALRNDHTECAKLLIQRGAKLNVTSALRSAVEHQRPLYMRFLFENYKRKMIYCFSKTTLARELLFLAVEKENSEIIGLILDAGVDVNVADFYGQTPLMASKNKAVVELLIQRGADVNHIIEGRNGSETPLTLLISGNYMSTSAAELCKVLIDNGASVNCRSGEGKTPLMMAASQGDNVSMLHMLLDNGTDVNDKDNKGNTALHHAITEQCFKNVSCLIDFIRDKTNVINIQNNRGLTPLIVSVMKGSVVIMKKLIEEGADVNIKDNNENTALHHLLIVCPRDREEMLTFLLKAGSHVNCQDRDGLSPLMLTARVSVPSLMSQLLDAGADVNIRDNNENTALHHLLIVCPGDSEEMLTFLLKAGSHVNCQNRDGLSPLMLTARMSEASLMSKLLDAGADVSAVSKNNDSQTAMSFLHSSPHFENKNILCIEALLHRDANSSYFSHEYFSSLIIQDEIDVIPKLIQHGVGPADVRAHKIPWKVTRPDLPTTLSPLCVALLHGNISLAQYFVDILFLTSSDLSMFASNRAMVCLLKKGDKMQSWNFLQELSSQPMSLDKLCLVTVSAAVGSSPGRETRLDSLPLPQMMKDRLRFKSMIEKDLALSKSHPEPNTTLTYVDSDFDDDNCVYASDYSDSYATDYSDSDNGGYYNDSEWP